MEHPESYELSLWKIGEQLDYSQCQILGERLRIKRAKLRNIYAKVQSGICSQEEMNFEILHKWMANQTPRDNPVAYLKDILVKDLEFHRDDVQEIFKRETLLSESTTERSLGELQFYQIAEKVDKGLHIPLTLRLGLTFTDLQVSRQNNGGNAVQSLFEMLCRWQKALPSKIDQFQSMCNILEASEQKLLAYSIECNTWGVENKSGKRIMLCEPPKSVGHEELLCDNNWNINPPTAERIESLLKIIADISERIPSQSDLTGSKLQEMYDDCRRISQFLSNIQRAIGIQPMYELFGFTMSSFLLHVRALSDKGLARLKEDMSNGSIASRLEKELDTSELAREILSRMSGAREATDQSARHTANVTGRIPTVVVAYKDEMSDDELEKIQSTLQRVYGINKGRIFISRNMTETNTCIEDESKSRLLDFLDRCLADGTKATKSHEKKEEMIMESSKEVETEEKEKRKITEEAEFAAREAIAAAAIEIELVKSFREKLRLEIGTSKLRSLAELEEPLNRNEQKHAQKMYREEEEEERFPIMKENEQANAIEEHSLKTQKEKMGKREK